LAAQVDAPAGDVQASDPDAERRRREREKKARQRAQAKDPTSTTVPSRPGRPPGPPKGNPFGFGRAANVGDPIGKEEATRNLKAAHLALAKIVRSRIDVDGLDDEFRTAGEAYSDVANHILPWLRLFPRLVSPLILVGALIAIWGAIIVETPWVRAWWERRRAEREARRLEQEAAAAAGPPPARPAPVVPVPGSAVAAPMTPPATEPPVEHPPIPNLNRGGNLTRRLG
jgi:hypothetical protein